MPEKNDKDYMNRLKWKTAKDLGLDDDLRNADELTVREAGMIGGNMVKQLIEKGEEVLAREEEQKQRPDH
jgi:hypothetical protein